jgi:biopolymer transport protein ExbB
MNFANAEQGAQMMEALTRYLSVGGPVVWILLAMSLLLLTILIVKIWQFYRSGLFSVMARKRADLVVNQWQAGDADKAMQIASEGRDLHNRTLLHAIKHLSSGTLTGKALQSEIIRMSSTYLAHLRSHLHSIELIAGLAPLLGLLGTVLGMIEAFQAMEAAGKQVEPSILSGGIWKALLTTAVGLIVAVPAIVIHNWLERRCERFADSLNDRVGRIMTKADMKMSAERSQANLGLARAGIGS